MKPFAVSFALIGMAFSGGIFAQNRTVPQPTQTVPSKSVPMQSVPTKSVPMKTLPSQTVKAGTVKSQAVRFQPTPARLTPTEITSTFVNVYGDKNRVIFRLNADLLFDFDRDTIRPDAQEALKQISGYIRTHLNGKAMDIDGHTDSKGSDAYNLPLSQRRAEAVKRWLIARGGLAASRMTTHGYGESRPVAPNTETNGRDNPAGRQKNRRAEIVVYKR